MSEESEIVIAAGAYYCLRDPKRKIVLTNGDAVDLEARGTGSKTYVDKVKGGPCALCTSEDCEVGRLKKKIQDLSNKMYPADVE